jgi:hypothetical protein
LWVVIRAPLARAEPFAAARIVGGGDQVDVVAGLGPPPHGTRDLDRFAPRVRPEVGGEVLRNRQHLREQQPLRRRAVLQLAERCENVLLHLGSESLDPADTLLLRRGTQIVEARDGELVVEAPGRLRSDAGDPGHLDQRGREPALQLCRGGNLARIEQREDLLLERPADPWELRDAAGARELLDGDGALADHARGLAIGQDPVPDCPVQLVERGQLAQRCGDFGVSHRTRNSIAGCRTARGTLAVILDPARPPATAELTPCLASPPIADPHILRAWSPLMPVQGRYYILYSGGRDRENRSRQTMNSVRSGGER